VILHAPLALLVGLFAFSLATASPEAGLGGVASEVPSQVLTLAGLR
jgi:hypothetical protein